MKDFSSADWVRTLVTVALMAMAAAGFWGAGERNQYLHDSIDRVGAVCEDGSRSDSTGRGTCSGHGGVDYWQTEYEDVLGVHRGRSSLPDLAAHDSPLDLAIENYGLFLVAGVVMWVVTGVKVKERREEEARALRG